MRARKPPGEPPTEQEVELALEHEFRVMPTEEGYRHWGIDIPMRFQVKGPLIISSRMEPDGVDDMTVEVEMGEGLLLHLPWDAAEATMFSIMSQLYGKQWARLMMALCARCPVDYNELEFDGLGEGIPPEVAQTLWAAAYSWRDRWPKRQGGFDDHIWGCAPPAKVKPVYPSPEERP